MEEQQPKPDQSAIWNTHAGHAWVESQQLLDRVFAPFEQLLVEAVTAAGARRVLDIGCGTGSTSLAIARALGARGHCRGIDISEPMLALARSRAQSQEARPSFLLADAQKHPFSPASFDMVVSRFGVMFFDDPVAAFANLQRACRRGGELRVITWRSPADNPFMTTAERAAAPLLPDLPPRQPNAPGQFAFADPERVRQILGESGWTHIEIQPIDIACSFPEKELIRYFTRLGPLGMILPDVDERTRERVIETVRAAFEPYVEGTEVRFTAACWVVSALA